MNVDIIIPIYNAYEDLVICVDSILKHTDLALNRIIMVNDKSSDERILSYLEKLETNKFIVINNEKNLGFSASVNKGILYSNTDIILLNSDTIVTKNWVQKLTKCAYSQKSIATVTPLSNNAGLCSIPNFMKDNEIPLNMTIDEFAEIVERCSLKKFPKIPVANGFCMYIKREVISKIGLLDADVFGKGYGEENDFCFRAEQLGFTHVMCDDTFIYHKGSVSFLKEEKKLLTKKNQQILVELYEKQEDYTYNYMLNNPDEIIRENIKIYLSLNNRRKNILYLLHSDFRDDVGNNIGGTQFHVRDMVMNQNKANNMFVLARDGEYLRLTIYTELDKISFKFFIGKPPIYPVFYDDRLKNIFNSILCAFSIDLVHIHHTLGFSFDLFYEAKKLNIPILLSIHDYYFVCPTLKLLNKENELCITKDYKDMCKKCLNAKLSISYQTDFIENWRLECKEIFKLCELIITPTKTTKELICQYYNHIVDKTIVIEHGIDEIKKDDVIFDERKDSSRYHLDYILDKKNEYNVIEGWAYLENVESKKTRIFIQIVDEEHNEYLLLCSNIERVDLGNINEKYSHSGFFVYVPNYIISKKKLGFKIIIEHDNVFYYISKYIDINTHLNKKAIKIEQNSINVAFIGGIDYTKGSKLAYSMIKNSNKHINWYVFGGIGDEDLYHLKQENVYKTGWYTRDDLKYLFKQYKIDLVCILSTVPETFCYTLSESIINNIPVIVTDIGALGERTRTMACGWVVPVDIDAKNILNLINEIKDNRNIYNEKLIQLKKLKMKSVNQMVQEYSKIYKNYNVTQKKEWFDTTLIFLAYQKCNTEQMFNGEKIISDEVFMKMKYYQEQLQSINNSLGYRTVLLFRKIRIPFKNKIKKFLIWMYRISKKYEQNK